MYYQKLLTEDRDRFLPEIPKMDGISNFTILPISTEEAVIGVSKMRNGKAYSPLNLNQGCKKTVVLN